MSEQILGLLVLLALGTGLGHLSVRGISIGSAGVLFVALVFGHLGFTVPREVTELGLLLFVYAVGLQAGPRFFRTFRRRGAQWVVIGVATALTGAVAAVATAAALRLPGDIAAGLFCGALTCTPALAAAMDALARAGTGLPANASVGYGIAYPFSMLGVVVLVQLLPRFLHRDPSQEAARALEEQQAEQPALEVRQFRVTNPNCFGRPLRELNPRRISTSNISRVRRGERVHAATPAFTLQADDVVMVVGPPEELEKMRLLLGEETDVTMDDPRIGSVDVEVRQDEFTGRTLAEMKIQERFGVLVTRIRRQGLELAPTGSAVVEMGDHLRVVGEQSAVEAFVHAAFGEQAKGDLAMFPFLIGLTAGVALGSIPFHLGGMTVRLGTAGGAFLASLLIGHFGRVGTWRLHVPPGARFLARELGLILFLAGAGTAAGARIGPVLQEQGGTLLAAGAVLTVLTVAVGLALMHALYRMNLLSTMGALCAAMTNPPALSAAQAQTDSDLPMLSYASVYPVALIFKIVLAQVLVGLL